LDLLANNNCASGVASIQDITASALGQAHGGVIMSNTVIGIVISVISIAFIFWLVVFGGKRGEKHREQTSIKAPDSGRDR